MTDMSITRVIGAMLTPMKSAIRGMFSALTVRSVDDRTRVQSMRIEVTEGDIHDAEHAQNFGFSSVAPAGSEGVCASIGGDQEHAVVLAAFDRETRPRGLNPGETVVYNDRGVKIELLGTGQVLVTAQSIRLGEAAGRGVARQEDITAATEAMSTWAAAVEAGILSAAGTPPPKPFASAAAQAMGQISTSSDKVTAE